MNLSDLEQADAVLRRWVLETPANQRAQLLPTARRAAWAVVDGARLEDHPLTPEIWSEPHALGWLHQHLGEENRKASFSRHVHAEDKHADSTTSTQVYTPRWVADFLVAQCFEVAGAPPCSVLDPACGGGQMLLAAFDRFLAEGLAVVDAIARLRGTDVDPRAVEVCRENLALHAARHAGGRLAEVDTLLGETIRVADGLVDPCEPAEVVLTNPPYMGQRSMPPALAAELKSRRPFHLDLYLAFADRCLSLASRAAGLLAQQTMWFGSRFEPARRQILERAGIVAFAHLGTNIFGALSGEKASTAAVVLAPGFSDEGKFWDLRAQRDAGKKRQTLISTPPKRLPPAAFDALPGHPIAHWLEPTELALFATLPPLESWAHIPGNQNKTGANARYVRRLADLQQGEVRRVQGVCAGSDDGRWVPYSKGGPFAPWWGNWDWAVDWSSDARAFYAENPTSNLLPQRYWNREGLCYSDFGGKTFGARWKPAGCLFDMAGPAIFVDGDDPNVLATLLVLLNSSVARRLLNALNPSLHYQARDLRHLPTPPPTSELVSKLAPLGHRLTALTREVLQEQMDVDTLEEHRRLEIQADQAATVAWGLRPSTLAPPVHHALRRGRDSRPGGS